MKSTSTSPYSKINCAHTNWKLPTFQYQFRVGYLIILDSHGAEITKKQTSLVHFAWLFHNQAILKKIELSSFDRVAIDAKNMLTFGKHHLVAEVKLKCHQLRIFMLIKCRYTFTIYDHLIKKGTFRFLEDSLIVK